MTISSLTIFGTRPEAIKLAPIIRELGRRGIDNRVCLTAQHREMLYPFLSVLGIKVEHDLAIMQKDQTIYHITTETLSKLKGVLNIEVPDVVIVQGDTSTTFAAALAAFYEKIPVAHVEAGLRSGAEYTPFPEEMNRRLTDCLARWLFAPTEEARQNLLREGVDPERIFVTGNTVVDALLMTLADERFRKQVMPISIPPGQRLILVTAHRRENFGPRLKAICLALREIVENNEDVEVVFPVHLNPNVRGTANLILRGVKRVHLLEPLDYLSFLKLMESSYLILTDSGGIQEEAPTLGKPVLVMREETERPEIIRLGVARLVGTRTERIVREAERLLGSEDEYKKMVTGTNPYGNGRAALSIVEILRRELSTTSENRLQGVF